MLYLARHECGTKICREKGIEFARRLLGHANISTTQRYVHVDDRELADAQDLVEWTSVGIHLSRCRRYAEGAGFCARQSFRV